MAWTDPAGHVWAVGEVLSAANMNTYIANDLVFLGTPPNCRAYNNAVLSVNSATVTALALNTENFKSDSGMHSTSSNTSRLIATIASKYEFKANIAWATSSAAGTVREALLRINGTTQFGASLQPPSTAYNVTNVAVADYALAAGDYVELCAYQDSGGAMNVNTFSFSPVLSMSWSGF